MTQLKGELVYGLMQLQVFEILKAQGTSTLTHTTSEVCTAIMYLEEKIRNYVALLETEDENEKQQRKKIRESIRNIGEELNATAGFDLMIACCYLVSYSSPDTGYDSYINRIWNGVGEWMS